MCLFVLRLQACILAVGGAEKRVVSGPNGFEEGTFMQVNASGASGLLCAYELVGHPALASLYSLLVLACILLPNGGPLSVE